MPSADLKKYSSILMYSAATGVGTLKIGLCWGRATVVYELGEVEAVRIQHPASSGITLRRCIQDHTVTSTK